MPKLSSLGFFPELKAGVAEALNPGGLTVLLLFLLLILFVFRQRRFILAVAVSFVIGNGLAKLALFLGFFDRLFDWPYFNFTVANAYFLLTVVFYFLGAVFLRDWWTGLIGAGVEGGKFVVPAGIFAGAGLPPRPRWARFWISIKAALAGFFLVLFQVGWGNDDDLVLLIFQAFQPGKEPAVWMLFSAYVVSTELPLIALAGALCLVIGKEERDGFLSRNLGKVRVILAAVFLAYAISFWAAYGPDFIRSYYQLLS